MVVGILSHSEVLKVTASVLHAQRVNKIHVNEYITNFMFVNKISTIILCSAVWTYLQLTN